MKKTYIRHRDITRGTLIGVCVEMPGVAIGYQIAALMLILNGEELQKVTERLGIPVLVLERWIQSVNKDGLTGLRVLTSSMDYFKKPLKTPAKRSPVGH